MTDTSQSPALPSAPLPSSSLSTSSFSGPIQLSCPLPHAPHARLRIHLTILETSILLFLASSMAGEGGGGVGDLRRDGLVDGGGGGGDYDEIGLDATDEAGTETVSGMPAVAMGSFVYTMPDLHNPSNRPLSTALYPHPPSTLDFATACGRILARRLRKPVYVGNSISLQGLGMGGAVEEEMAVMRQVVDVVMGVVERRVGGGVGKREGMVNGVGGKDERR